MTTGKTIDLTIRTFVGKVMSLLLNMLSRFVIAFLPRSQVAFNFMAAVTISSDFVAQENKIYHCFHFSPFYLINRKGPVLHDNAWPHVTQSMLQMLNKLDYKVLPYLPYSSDLSPTDYHFFKHLDNFLPGKHFHNQQKAENAFQEFNKSQNMYFYATGTNQLISHW